MPCSKHCLHCVGKVSAIQIGQEWDLRVCVLHALARLCFQLLWLCLSGLPPVPMHCNMLGIREHISLWTRVSLHLHTLLIRKRLIHTLIIRTHAHRMIYLLVLIITHTHTQTHTLDTPPRHLFFPWTQPFSVTNLKQHCPLLCALFGLDHIKTMYKQAVLYNLYLCVMLFYTTMIENNQPTLLKCNDKLKCLIWERSI